MKRISPLPLGCCWSTLLLGQVVEFRLRISCVASKHWQIPGMGCQASQGRCQPKRYRTLKEHVSVVFLCSQIQELLVISKPEAFETMASWLHQASRCFG